MECDFNLLCYGIFLIPKLIIILKVFLSIKKIFKKNSFEIFFMSYCIRFEIMSQIIMTLKIVK
jgi:hypothetical protein